MTNTIFRPLEKWPHKPTRPQIPSPFSSDYRDTLQLLDKELRHMNARSTIIQAFFLPGQIRNDGWPLSSAKPQQPGVILTFTNHKKETFSYPCDRFVLWQDNLRAIALALEALRKVDRYGVTRNHEQYQGFKQIEAPPAPDPFHDAAEFIAQHTAGAYDYHAVLLNLDDAYKAAARNLHPDSGGSHELFVRLQKHYRELKQ